MLVCWRNLVYQPSLAQSDAYRDKLAHNGPGYLYENLLLLLYVFNLYGFA